MSFKLSILYLLCLIYQIISHPPPQLLFEDESINYQELEKNITKEYNDFRNKYKRRLSAAEPIYIEPVITSVLFNNSLIQTISVKIKAQGDISQITLYDMLVYALNSKLLLCELKLQDNKSNNVALGKNDTCTLRDNYYIDINTNLKNDYILSVKIQIFNNFTVSNYPIYHSKTFSIMPIFPGTKTKLLISVDPSLVKVKISYNKELVKPYNESAIIFDDILPDSAKSITIYVTPYEMKWEYILEIKADLKNKPDLVTMDVYKVFVEGGNIFNVVKNENETNINVNESNRRDKIYYDDEDDFYQLYDVQKGQIYFKRNVLFSTRPNNWTVPKYLDEKWVNTSTSDTMLLAKNILAEDSSSSPDYIKLGEWLYKNIKYNASRIYDVPSGLNATENNRQYLSQIILKKEGKCHDFTKIYNALLASIGIKAVYLSGYVFYEYDYDAPNHILEGGHAWTLAKINNKWIPLDATWNYFEGVFPQNHLFGPYKLPFANAYNWDDNDKTSTFNIIENIKFIEIAQNPFITENPLEKNNSILKRVNLVILFILNLLSLF